ncbi:hypothetical protein Bca4012_024461 [Brassica carinata]
MSSRNRRSSRINQLTKTILILGLLLILSSCCNGPRTTNLLSTSSPPRNTDIVSPPPHHHHNHQVQDYRSVHFWGFLPHYFPVPASGPSRKHNDIGLSTISTRSSP